MNRILKIVLSGAITGHEEEAKKYFMEAERAIHARYPLAEVFNPIRLPPLGWEECMVICRSRIKHWATAMVFIKNEHYDASRGSVEEKNLAIDRRLYLFDYDGKTVKEIPSCRVTEP